MHATVIEGRAQERSRQSAMCIAALESEGGACAGDTSGSAAAEALAIKPCPEGSLENATKELESIHKKLLAESLIVFHDKRTSSRQLATQILVRMVGRLAVVQGADDIQAVVDKLHVPHPSRSGVDAIITDLDPKVPKLMDYLRMRSLRPGLGKLPIVAVIVVVDAGDPRSELLASAIESGVDAVMRRPLERAVLTSCVGEVLRRHASVEFVYKDVVGEVETFNYPRFLLEGFQFLGAGESSIGGGGVGDADGFNDIVGEAVRTYTLQSGGSGNGSMTTVGSGGWAPDGPLTPNGGLAAGAGTLRSPSVAPATSGTPRSAPPGATTAPTAAAAVVATATAKLATAAAGGTTDRRENDGGVSVDSGAGSSKLASRVMGKAKVVSIMQGGHVKISSPSLRPRLYLYPGDKGYVGVGAGSTTGTGPSRYGRGGNCRASCGTGDVVAADRRAESERQVSHELAPFVKRKAPVLGDPATSAGLHKGALARTMKLVENTFSFTKGQDAKTAWRAKGRSSVSSVPGFSPAAAAANVDDGQHDNTGGKNTQGVPIAATAPLGGAAGGSWKAAPRRTPLPESGNPVSQKKVFSASGTQGRRAATRAGMFDEVTRHQANINPTEIASTADLKSALGVGVAGQAAARAVIGRMMKKRIQAERRAAGLATDTGKGRGRLGGGDVSGGRGKGSCFSGGGDRGNAAPGANGLSSRDKQAGRSRTAGSNELGGRSGGWRGKGQGGCSRGDTTGAAKGPRATKAIKGIAGSGNGAGFLEEGMFKTVLSSLAKERLRAGLLKIKTNPTDVLRCGFVEIEPARYGSTALGCHLIRGWANQKAGNRRRALGHYRKAVASEPENVEALFCKAVVSAQLMELFDALKDFSAAISFKLDEITTASLQRGAFKKGAGRTMGSGHVNAAASSSNGALGASRGLAAPATAGGAGGTQTHERRGSGESGESNVNLAHLYGNRALVHVCLGDDASALDDLDRAVARDTRNITYRSNRALILRRVGDFRGAQQDYSRIRALQNFEQAAADRSAARTLATSPTGVQQEGTTVLGPPPPTACAAEQEATAEPRPMAENGQNGDHEAPPQPSQPTVDNVRPETDGAGSAVLSACPRPSTSPTSLGPRREQDAAAGNRGNSSNGEGQGAMLKGDEIAATAATMATGHVAGLFPAVTTETTPPTSTAVNSTSKNITSIASAITTTHDSSNNDNNNGNKTGNTSSSPNNPTTGDKVDARPSEEWSDQFRDRRLMEDTFRRRVLLRRLFSPDAESETEYPDEEYGTGAGAGAGGKRSGGGFRKKSGQGASLGEFKTSMGLSAKGALFDDLFCRPSYVDEALTTEPGRRTPEQVDHVVEALAACPTLNGLGKDTLEEIGKAAEYRVLEKMAPAFLQGEETDAMAVVLSGRVAVKMRRADLSVVTADELGPGETFGEACMLEEYWTLALRRRGSLYSIHDDDGGENDENNDGNDNNNDKDDNAPRKGDGEAGEAEEGGPRTDSSTPRRATTAPGRETKQQQRKLEARDKSDACRAVSGESGLTDAVDATGGGGPSTNPNVGRSMETYQTLEPTRLVLILKADFHRIPGLLKHISHAFKRRLEAIQLSGLFGGWENEDLMRLARMSRIHRHASKSVLLMQRKEPSHLHIVLSGTCTVTKYPDRLAAVRRKINEIGAALYRIKSKYSYHRDVRTKVAKNSSSRPTIPKTGPLLTGSGHPNANAIVAGRPASAPAVGGGHTRLPRALVAECSAPLPHVTSTEVRKAELEREMRKWTRTLALIRRKDGDVVDISQTQNVGTLQFPQFFGEMCLLVPDGGEALGTVSTDTLVETVSMSKFVLQTFHVTDTFLQGVRQKSSIYPEDINLAKAIEADRWWEVRRRELVLEALVGPTAGIGGKHKNQWLIRKRPKRSATAS